MIPESLTLATKGLFLLVGAGAANLVFRLAQITDAGVPTELVKGLEGLGTNGLLVLGIWFLHRANQKIQEEKKQLEAEIRKLHEDNKASTDTQLALLKEELKSSSESRERLYEAIRGALDK